MKVTRTIGFLVIVAGALAIWFLMAPKPIDSDTAQIDLSARDYVTLVNQALDDFQANESIADSAPKQQVVAGWAAKDLLSIIALAQADQMEALGGLADQNQTVVSAMAVRDDRIPALIGLAVLAICWYGLTESRPREETTLAGGEGRHTGIDSSARGEQGHGQRAPFRQEDEE